MHTAYKENLTMLFGDTSFVVNKPIYRRKEYDRASNITGLANNNKFGTLVSVQVSNDGANYQEIDFLDSAIIDSKISMREQSKDVTGTRTVIFEASNSTNILQLSSSIMYHVAKLGVNFSEEIATMSSYKIVDLFRKLGMPEIYIIPKAHHPTSDMLFYKALPQDWLKKYYYFRDGDADLREI